MGLLIGFLALSIIFSFLCSVWEAVLLSVTPSYIKRLEQEGNNAGPLLAELKKEIDRPLSAILTLNTIAHTVGAIGVGAQAGKLYGSQYVDILGFHLTYESIIATLMTLAILFVSEIIPKTIGANNWQNLAPITAKSLKGLTFVLSPFVWVSTLLTKAMKKDKEKSVFSKQDFAAMAQVANESGEIENEDYELIKNVLKYDDLQVKEVMTPQTVIVMASEEQTLGDFYQANKEGVFSRIPVYGKSKNEITGIILKDHLLTELVEGNNDKQLKNIKREAVFLKETQTLRQSFETLHQNKAHLAIVLDEYGGLAGVATLEDILETLLGLEIVDETDKVADMQKLAKEQWENKSKELGLE